MRGHEKAMQNRKTEYDRRVVFYDGCDWFMETELERGRVVLEFLTNAFPHGDLRIHALSTD